MKTFIAYRFTGEDPSLLEPLLIAVRDALTTRGIDAYCTFFDEQEFEDKAYTQRQILDHAFQVIDDSDFLFVLQTSENKSEGMLLEVGYSLAKGIPIVAAVKDGIKYTLIPDVAKLKSYWTNPEDLVAAIKNFEFAELPEL